MAATAADDLSTAIDADAQPADAAVASAANGAARSAGASSVDARGRGSDKVGEGRWSGSIKKLFAAKTSPREATSAASRFSCTPSPPDGQPIPAYPGAIAPSTALAVAALAPLSMPDTAPLSMPVPLVSAEGRAASGGWAATERLGGASSAFLMPSSVLVPGEDDDSLVASNSDDEEREALFDPVRNSPRFSSLNASFASVEEGGLRRSYSLMSDGEGRSPPRSTSAQSSERDAASRPGSFTMPARSSASWHGDAALASNASSAASPRMARGPSGRLSAEASPRGDSPRQRATRVSRASRTSSSADLTASSRALDLAASLDDEFSMF